MSNFTKATGSEQPRPCHVVCQCSCRTDSALLLRLLQCLPVKHSITYKTAVVTHKVLTTFTPPYLHDTLRIVTPARLMCSAGAPLLSVSCLPSSLGACSPAGPTVYKSLPADIQTSDRHWKLIFLRRKGTISALEALHDALYKSTSTTTTTTTTRLCHSLDSFKRHLKTSF